MRVVLQAGTLFHERFLIIKQLGVGGMGSVYLAEQLEARRKVALKIMHSDFGDSPEERQDRFMREFQVLSRLQHANIVTFYSAAITPEGTQYAVCEYITGKSLQELLSEETRLPWSRVAQIGAQVCDAVIYAHENNVVHRDLKPANIMLLNHPEPDTVKVIDFGLAKITSGDLIQKLTQTGELVGSPHYMSPEQILGKKVDPRSDLYALACIIFECLAGKRLFDDDTAISIIRKHVQEDPLKPIEREFSHNEKLLHSCLGRALAKEPEQRFKSVADFKESFLDLCAAHEASSLADMHRPNSLAKPLVITVISLALLALSAFVFLNNQKSSKEGKSSAIVERSTNSQTAALDKLQVAVNRLEQRLEQESDQQRRQDIYVELKLKLKKLWSAQSKMRLYNEQLASQQHFLKLADLTDNPAMFNADLLENIAKTQMDLEQYEQAAASLKEAEKHLNKDTKASILLRGRWHCATARLQVSMHKFVDARDSFMKARSEWKKHGKEEQNLGDLFTDQSVRTVSHKKRFQSSLDDFEVNRAVKVLNNAMLFEPVNDRERLEYCQLLNAITGFLVDNFAVKDAIKSLSRTSLEMEKLPENFPGLNGLKAEYRSLQKSYDSISDAATE